MFDYISEMWQVFLNRPDYLAVLSIIPVTAIVTWAHVWMALKMVFYPINFWGFHLGPLPVGWQGIVRGKLGVFQALLPITLYLNWVRCVSFCKRWTQKTWQTLLVSKLALNLNT